MELLLWVIAVLLALKSAIGVWLFASDQFPYTVTVYGGGGMLMLLVNVGLLVWCLIILL